MAYMFLWSSAVRVYDSQAYRKIDVTRERNSRISELREILLSFQTIHVLSHWWAPTCLSEASCCHGWKTRIYIYIYIQTLSGIYLHGKSTRRYQLYTSLANAWNIPLLYEVRHVPASSETQLSNHFQRILKLHTYFVLVVCLFEMLFYFTLYILGFCHVLTPAPKPFYARCLNGTLSEEISWPENERG